MCVDVQNHRQSRCYSQLQFYFQIEEGKPCIARKNRLEKRLPVSPSPAPRRRLKIPYLAISPYRLKNRFLIPIRFE